LERLILRRGCLNAFPENVEFVGIAA